MRALLLTSNQLRHKFVANSLFKSIEKLMVISECKLGDFDFLNSSASHIKTHFRNRFEAEAKYFSGNETFKAPTLPILYGEINTKYIEDVLTGYKPEIVFVYGSSIIRPPILSLFPPSRAINLHLGISPYYRGSGTNFWPFVNNELHYIGSTLLHIDPGVDTGDIITHIRPEFDKGDNVHSVGSKVIKASLMALIKCYEKVLGGEDLPRIKQWESDYTRIYRKKDFNEESYETYNINIKNGCVKKFASSHHPQIELVNWGKVIRA